MNDMSFFMVWNPQGSAPRVRHPSYEDARKEAERLARLNPGQTFVVLCSVGHCQHSAVTWTEHDQIPF